MDDAKKNMSFHSHFIHKTRAKIKKLHTQDIVNVTSGYGFIFYCLIAILIFILLLSLCFCPGLLLGFVKCIVSHIMQFVTWFCAITYEGLQFVFSALTAYRARRQEQNIDNMVDNQVTRPFIPTSVSFNEQPTIQNEVQFCDPSSSNDCPTIPIVSESRPIQKVLRYKNPSASIIGNDGASVIVQASAPFYPPMPQTPTFQRIFRE